MTGALPFLRSWLANPLRVGAIAPSGRALARLITSEIGPQTGPVIELGPGTGAFTRALLARGVPSDQLALVERGADFARLLQQRFPSIKVLPMDAAQLDAVEPFGGAKAGAVVSGLPLLSMPHEQVLRIIGSAFHHLRADGAFYQFTYGPRCPVQGSILDQLGLDATRIGRALVNLPPAAVYRLRRRA